MIPEARIVHQSEGRVRLRIASMRGRPEYFAGVIQAFERRKKISLVACNPTSGSLLFAGPGAAASEIARAAEGAALFTMDLSPHPPLPLARRVAQPIRGIDRTIRRHSEGALDLPGAFFIVMFFLAFYELSVGNFRRPPWYTLFWYAFGVFSKSVADHVTSEEAG